MVKGKENEDEKEQRKKKWKIRKKRMKEADELLDEAGNNTGRGGEVEIRQESKGRRGIQARERIGKDIRK